MGWLLIGVTLCECECNKMMGYTKIDSNQINCYIALALQVTCHAANQTKEHIKARLQMRVTIKRTGRNLGKLKYLLELTSV